MAVSLFRIWGRCLPVVTSSSCCQPITLTYTSLRQIFGNKEVERPTAKLIKAFQLLNLHQDDCTEEEIRQAYIKLAKKYHPDSSSSEANADQFSQVREAYKRCMSYTKNISMTRDIYAALEQELADLDKLLGYSATKQRRLAHRHYLSYDVGVGTLAQRQRAQAQERVNQAMDSVFEKQFQKALENPDVKEVVPYQKGRKVPGGKTTKSLQRIANEIIYDSMKSGDFDNLSGQGKPLKLDPANPVLDNIEQKINKMLSNSGFAPEWISLDKEIRTDIDRLRVEMERVWNKYGPLPMCQEQAKTWQQHLAQFQESVESINKKIFNLNLIVPSLRSQRSGVAVDRLLNSVMETPPVPESADHEDMQVSVEGARDSDPLVSLYRKIVSNWHRYWHK